MTCRYAQYSRDTSRVFQPCMIMYYSTPFRRPECSTIQSYPHYANIECIMMSSTDVVCRCGSKSNKIEVRCYAFDSSRGWHTFHFSSFRPQSNMVQDASDNVDYVLAGSDLSRIIACIFPKNGQIDFNLIRECVSGSNRGVIYAPF